MNRHELAGTLLYKICHVLSRACFVCKQSYDDFTVLQLGNLEFDHGVNHPHHASNRDPEVFFEEIKICNSVCKGCNTYTQVREKGRSKEKRTQQKVLQFDPAHTDFIKYIESIFTETLLSFTRGRDLHRAHQGSIDESDKQAVSAMRTSNHNACELMYIFV
jgi:hypothetical protein